MTTTALTHSNGNGQSSLTHFGEMSVQNIIDRKRKMAEVMNAVMQADVHYGKIPGCGDKPSLFKAGAEVCATVFGLAPTFKVVRTDLPDRHREYEITCTLVHIATGAIVGEGVGCCSTMESKYRWRKAERTCPKCGQPAILKSRTAGEGYFCWAKKGGCGAKFADGAKEIEGQEVGRAENPDIADTYNTVLKIAKKRAQVDATLTAVGASDILTQDLEDLPPGTQSFVDIPAADRDIEPQHQPPPSRQENRSQPRNGNGNGNGNHDSRSNTNGTRSVSRPSQADEERAEEMMLELLPKLDEARTPEAVRALAVHFNEMPKGTRARAQAYEQYQRRLSDVTLPGAA